MNCQSCNKPLDNVKVVAEHGPEGMRSNAFCCPRCAILTFTAYGDLKALIEDGMAEEPPTKP